MAMSKAEGQRNWFFSVEYLEFLGVRDESSRKI